MTGEPLNVASTELKDDTEVFAVTGELTFANAAVLGRLLAPAVERRRRVVVDITQVPFVDSSGLSELLKAAAAGRDRGTSVAIVHGARQRPRIFGFRGVERLLPLFSTREGALGHDVTSG
jgi:anti-anti-sigma factor